MKRKKQDENKENKNRIHKVETKLNMLRGRTKRICVVWKIPTTLHNILFFCSWFFVLLFCTQEVCHSLTHALNHTFARLPTRAQNSNEQIISGEKIKLKNSTQLRYVTFIVLKFFSRYHQFHTKTDVNCFENLLETWNFPVLIYIVHKCVTFFILL